MFSEKDFSIFMRVPIVEGKKVIKKIKETNSTFDK